MSCEDASGVHNGKLHKLERNTEGDVSKVISSQVMRLSMSNKQDYFMS